MTTAIHISSRDNKPQRSFNFIVFSKIAADNPSDHFIFIFDSPPDPEIYLEPNCTPVIVGPTIKNLLLLHYWYNFKLPGILSKYNATIFVSSGVCCSGRSDVQQIAIANTITFRQKRSHVRKLIGGWLKKASSVIATNKLITEELIKDYSISADKIKTILPGLPEWNNSRDPAEATESNSYFIADSSSVKTEILVSILKAFSIFKKWQRSSFELKLIAENSREEEIKKLLSTYKYRNSVEYLPARSANSISVLQNAFAIISSGPELPIRAIAAGQNGVPVISIENKFSTGFFDDAVLAANANVDDIAAKMMMLYKDEHFYRSISDKAKVQMRQYSWDIAASSIWDMIAGKGITS